MSPPNSLLNPLAATLSLAIIATPAIAQDPHSAHPEQRAKELDTVQVLGEQPKKASSAKYTEPLLDTPQTITVVSKQVMDQQALLGLRDVLSTLPGITFGAGEGGVGYGDSINLRGFSASADITSDGIRDSAQYTRSDTFNLSAIELINGANSAVSGAGSVGGTINLVSKTPQATTAHQFTAGAGNDRYGRLTADSNIALNNGVAMRLNAMGHTQDVPGRDEEFRHRWGFAPSIAFGLGSDTRFTLSYLHQSDNNLPQYGVPYTLSPSNRGPLPGVDPDTYFGYRNTSRQDTDVDMLTGVLEMDFGDNVRLRSLGRLQRVDQSLSVTSLQGTWCLDSGINPYTGQACAATQPAGTWDPNSGPRGYVRDTENFLATSQTDLSITARTGAVEHHLVAGLALTKEEFELDIGNVFRNPDGSTTGITYPLQDLQNPYNVWTGPINHYRIGRTTGSLTNQAVYLFDTMKFGERWLLNIGARYEANEGDSVNYLLDQAGAITGLAPGYPARNKDHLLSYRAGLVYKPVDNASIYLSYANSKTPSKASVNGTCTPFNPADPTASFNCNVDPETAVNIELGTKWDLIDQRLALTAAVFRNERRNYKVPSVDPLLPEQVLDGQARVDGAALGAAGHINDAWAIFANYTFLDSEVLQGASDGGPDPTRGRALIQTPRHSGSVWTTYALDAWTFGYGATYQGEIYPNNGSSQGYLKADDYWVHRAMVSYQVNDSLSLQLNVNNLLDKTYYTTIRSNLTVNNAGVVTGGNGWALPGDGRSAVLTATLQF